MAQLETLKVGILAGTLPEALKIYDELQSVAGLQLHLVLCRVGGEARRRFLFKHAARFVANRGRLTFLRLMRARRVILLQEPPDHPDSLNILSQLKLDIGLHKVGVIYREPTINAFRLGILNAHIGLLPGFRGRAVLEWSLIEGEPTGITVFFIDTGIDTGRRIVLREEVDISHCRSINEAKRYLFNLDAPFFRRAIERMREDGFTYTVNDLSLGRRYYVMSRLFQEVAEKIVMSNE